MANSRMTQEPVVWSTFEVVRRGKKCKITIQDLTADLVEPAIDHMCTYIIERENICKSIDLKNDALAMADIRGLWKAVAKQGLAIVAVLDEDENPPPHRLIGVNFTFISKKEEKMDLSSLKSEKCKHFRYCLMKAKEESDIYGKYGVDKYLTSCGLSVHPAYHGIKLGQRLLEAREAICKANGIKVTATTFSSFESQRVAEKAGFHTVQDWIYSEFMVDGQVAFPKAVGKLSMKAKVYDL